MKGNRFMWYRLSSENKDMELEANGEVMVHGVRARGLILLSVRINQTR